jgi:hypothetical protein
VSKHPDAPELATDSSGKKSTDLRTRLAELPPTHASNPDYPTRPATDGAWQEAKARFAEAWQSHQERWPHPEEKAKRAELSATVERELADGCDKIQAAEEEITGRLIAIEAEQPGRILVGLEFCLKGRERVIEKATEYMQEMPAFTPTQALAIVPDPVRYTFAYDTNTYSRGVLADIDRLQFSGFEMIKLKNYWDDPEYKGINTQWRDAGTGQRFEVQFHTAFSFDAKQITHEAYERLREGEVTDEEELELEDVQREVTVAIPWPQGASEISEHG